MKTAGYITTATALLLTLVPAPPGTAQDVNAPPLAYETVVPGYYLSSGRGIAVDPEGNAYVIGSAYEDHFHLDILVVKLGPDGTPLWTRYIVGDGHDYATDIALDAVGDVFLTGWTDSGDFPIVNGLDGSLTGFREAFVMKLSGLDGTILTSTFLGGDYTDEGWGIALDEAGEVYVVGSTKSMDFPTTPDAFQGSPSAPPYAYKDAFITRLSTTMDVVLYSTYFGGYKNDTAMRVALAEDGSIIFAGETDADDFPLADPIQSMPSDLFVAELSADGSLLQFGTYLGGEDVDRISDMTMDSQGYVYLTGSTRSIDFPTTAGAFQEEFAGEVLGCGSPPFEPLRNCEDGFITKLATDGGGLVFSTYLGGSSVDECRNVAIDRDGAPVLVGFTSSTDFPGSSGEQGVIFVSKLTPAGDDLVYSLPKRSGSPAGHGIAVGPLGDIFFAGAVNVPSDMYVARVNTRGFTTGVVGVTSTPGALQLGMSVPNPFTSSTRLLYSLPAGGGFTSLGVYDVTGRRVTTLIERPQSTGTYRVDWDGTDLHGVPAASGVYFYRLEWNGQSRTSRVVMVR